MARKTKAEASGTEPRLLDLQGASAYTGIPAWSLRRMVWSGSLPTIQLPALENRNRTARRIWIAREDLDRLIESGRTTIAG
jgi:hypothetical protein